MNDIPKFKGWHVNYEPYGDSPDESGEGGGTDGMDVFTGEVVRFEAEYDDDFAVSDVYTHIICNGIESPADARLIAAAPDLRDALTAMLRAHGNCGSPAEQAAADMATRALLRLEPHALDVQGGEFRRPGKPEKEN